MTGALRLGPIDDADGALEPGAGQSVAQLAILHLIGNSIFLISLGCLYYCVRSKWIRWAAYIEGFHLYEHLMLTVTAYFLGKPVGLSTLFGGAGMIGSREFAVGYRVSWHFAMNLLPMPFAMIGLMEHMRSRAIPTQAVLLPRNR
ncbi:DUF6008 family protein [Bradyrhizobium liaoningense]